LVGNLKAVVTAGAYRLTARIAAALVAKLTPQHVGLAKHTVTRSATQGRESFWKLGQSIHNSNSSRSKELGRVTEWLGDWLVATLTVRG